MKELTDNAVAARRPHFEAAAKVALKATCLRAHCGSVVVNDGVVIGEGYNSPPLDKEENRTCDNVYTSTEKSRYDKTCCIHAEWRAVLDACKNNPEKIPGSTIYFMRIDGRGNFTNAGEPYCTTCSRLVMEAGIGTFALWQDDKVLLYDAGEYDKVSYAFFKPEDAV